MCSVHRSSGDDPSRRLTRDAGNVIEVRVVVKNGGAVVLRRRCGEKVNHSGGTVLAALRELQLNRPCPVTDLGGERKVSETIMTPNGNRSVLGRRSGRVEDFEIDRGARGK